MAYIAVVEDNLDFLDDVVQKLQRARHQVSGFSNAAAFHERLLIEKFDVVILDLGLPGEDGWVTAKRLRQNDPLVKLVMLTARVSEADAIQGYACGADVYLRKPVNMNELTALICSMERSLLAISGDGLAKEPDRWTLDFQALRLESSEGQTLSLTLSEAQLLLCFSRLPGQQATRRDLVEALNENFDSYDPRRLENQISRLRRRLMALDGSLQAIRALRNKGYQLMLNLRIKSTP
jgi:DNA-binding response OmpR family regulator